MLEILHLFLDVFELSFFHFFDIGLLLFDVLNNRGIVSVLAVRVPDLSFGVYFGFGVVANYRPAFGGFLAVGADAICVEFGVGKDLHWVGGEAGLQVLLL